jgi:hypothetical protein
MKLGPGLIAQQDRGRDGEGDSKDFRGLLDQARIFSRDFQSNSNSMPQHG